MGQFGDNYGDNYDIPAVIVTASSSSSGGGSRNYSQGPRLTLPSQYPIYKSEITGALPISLPILIQKSKQVQISVLARGATAHRMTVLQALSKPLSLSITPSGSLSAKLYSAFDASVHLQVPNLMRENRRAYIPIVTKKMKLAQIGSIMEILEGII